MDNLEAQVVLSQDHGYAQPSGSQSFTVLLTDLQLALYRKAQDLDFSFNSWLRSCMLK